MEKDFCEICRRRECCCKGMQTYAMSRYPGECALVKCHPSDTSVQLYYKREDVDALLDTLTHNVI